MNLIDVTVWATDGSDPIDFENVNYISLVNHETFGIPRLISEPRVKSEGLPVKILYVNPTNITAMEATRKS